MRFQRFHFIQLLKMEFNMAFLTSEFPGGYERHLLRRIHHAYLFDDVSANKDELLAEAITKDGACASVFSEQFESVLERAVSLKPSEETEVVLEVKAELDRLYTVTGSLCGLESSLVADLLNSDLGTGAYIPTEELIPTLLSADKSELADAVQLFDLEQTSEIIQQAERVLKSSIIKAEDENSGIALATEKLEFIKGYRVYLEGNV